MQLRFVALLFVRLIGLEPTHLAIPDPKSGASTNFATGAYGLQIYILFLNRQTSRDEILSTRAFLWNKKIGTLIKNI